LDVQQSEATAAWLFDVRECTAMELAHFQDVMRRTYAATDAARGIPSTIAWLAEEVGELAQAVRKGTQQQQQHEIGDVLAWVISLANRLDIDVEDALRRFAYGCPRCGALPCEC
jgi:NTP pyrophosphatase (non-canonical NTP hydrolase)